jgi:hypothetical protein
MADALSKDKACVVIGAAFLEKRVPRYQGR